MKCPSKGQKGSSGVWDPSWFNNEVSLKSEAERQWGNPSWSNNDVSPKSRAERQWGSNNEVCLKRKTGAGRGAGGGEGGVPAGQITKSSLKKDKEAVVGGAPSWCNTEVFLKRKAAGPTIKSLYNEYYYINID